LFTNKRQRFSFFSADAEPRMKFKLCFDKSV
jgi:hypothetical protein